MGPWHHSVSSAFINGKNRLPGHTWWEYSCSQNEWSVQNLVLTSIYFLICSHELKLGMKYSSDSIWKVSSIMKHSICRKERLESWNKPCIEELKVLRLQETGKREYNSRGIIILCSKKTCLIKKVLWWCVKIKSLGLTLAIINRIIVIC